MRRKLSINSIEKADEEGDFVYSLSEWCQDLAYALGEAGEEDIEFYHRRIEYL